MNDEANISELVGKVLSSVDVDKSDEDKITFKCFDGSEYVMFHRQDCCENVSIDDICGELNDLIGHPILLAEEVSNDAFEKAYDAKFHDDPDGWGGKVSDDGDCYPESHTWTFYKISTIKGSVTIRWFGSSNGYYSERVDFEKVNNSIDNE